jgi:hypothetical protein
MFTKIKIRNKNDPQKIIWGFLLWRTEHRFCLDVKTDDYYAYVFYFDEWEVIDYEVSY